MFSEQPWSTGESEGIQCCGRNTNWLDEGTPDYRCWLLWNDKVKDKKKTYIWVSVGQKTKNQTWLICEENTTLWSWQSTSLIHGVTSIFSPRMDSLPGGVLVYFFCLLLNDKEREVKRRLTYLCRCDERLKVKLRELHVSESLGDETIKWEFLSDTGLLGELEHLKIKTRLMDKKFVSVMGECVI